MCGCARFFQLARAFSVAFDTLVLRLNCSAMIAHPICDVLRSNVLLDVGGNGGCGPVSAHAVERVPLVRQTILFVFPVKLTSLCQPSDTHLSHQFKTTAREVCERQGDWHILGLFV